MLRLGLIGMSPGNGHPYSWGAIVNGYDPKEMEKCGFATIPRYLERELWPEATLGDAKVTHVWTQSPSLSAKIARASLIPNIAADLEDMLFEVDAVLLARDDALNHKNFAAPFLRAGVPVFVDKPPSLNTKSLRELYALETPFGRVFSCSALRFSSVLDVHEIFARADAQIKSVTGTAPKGWAEYSVHVIEPILRLLPRNEQIANSKVFRSDELYGPKARSIEVLWSSGVTTRFSTTGLDNGAISFRVMGDDLVLDRVFDDPFQSFRNALSTFVTGVIEGRVHEVDDRDLNFRVVELIERGLRR